MGILLPILFACSALLSPPKITALLKPEALRRILENRDIITNASLDDLPVPTTEGTRRYSYYASMLVHASLTRTRGILTDYTAYEKMVSYVDKTEFIRKPDLVRVEGGIWKFKLRSEVQFAEHGERWISYRIVGGHFEGLQGDFFFEPRGEQGTLVYMRGEQTGTEFPPKFVIEKGAEIVFAFTAKRMRSYIEDPKTEVPGAGGAPQNEHDKVPQPRSHL